MRNNNELLINEPLAGMMKACERFCVVYCCGIYAFDPGKESVGHWVADAGREKAQAAQIQLRALIEEGKISNAESNLEFVLRAEWMTGDECMSVKWTEGMDWLKDWDTALNEALKETK